MLQVSDVRETRVFQEALEERSERGIEKVATRLLKLGRPVVENAEATGLSKTQLRRLKQKLGR
jgi:predicted transposase YdaD